MAGSSSLYSPTPLTSGSRTANFLFATIGLLALALGVGGLALGGAMSLLINLTAPDDAQLAARPIVRTRAELDSWPSGTELLLEGRAQHALFPPDLTLRGAQLGLLTWHEERFDRRETVTAGRNAEIWTPVDTVCPTLAIQLRGTIAPVFIGADYRLLAPITQLQSDTPGIRPSPRAGLPGSWRYTGVRVGERVTVALRRTTSAVGESLPMRATELRPGTAADWMTAEAAGQRFSDRFRGLLLGLGGVLVAAGIFILVLGWRQRHGEADAPAARTL